MDEGRRSMDETAAFTRELYFDSGFHPHIGHRCRWPKHLSPTRGRTLVVGISPRRLSGCVSFGRRQGNRGGWRRQPGRVS